MEISQNVGAVRMFDQVCQSLTRRKIKKNKGEKESMMLGIREESHDGGKVKEI